MVLNFLRKHLQVIISAAVALSVGLVFGYGVHDHVSKKHAAEAIGTSSNLGGEETTQFRQANPDEDGDREEGKVEEEKNEPSASEGSDKE